jgi:hypothetical protein
VFGLFDSAQQEPNAVHGQPLTVVFLNFETVARVPASRGGAASDRQHRAGDYSNRDKLSQDSAHWLGCRANDVPDEWIGRLSKSRG